MKDSFVQQCLDILKREDIKNEFKMLLKPVIDFILRKNLMPTNVRPKHLTLIINSPGGELPSALALIDTMKGSAIPVHTVGLGMIASCGLLTFMSGAKGHRVLTPNTSILSHQFSWGSDGKAHELFATVKEFELLQKKTFYGKEKKSLAYIIGVMNMMSIPYLIQKIIVFLS